MIQRRRRMQQSGGLYRQLKLHKTFMKYYQNS